MYQRCAAGGYTRAASGAAKGCNCCLSGVQACPSGMAGSYTVSMPSSVNFGSCTGSGTCSTSTASVVLSGGCAGGSVGGWKISGAFSAPTCVAGHKTNADPAGTGKIKLYNDVDLSNCAAWIVKIYFADTSGVGDPAWYVTYSKVRTGASTNDIVGTYNLLSIVNNNTGVACSGATADATITVSP